MKDQLRYGLAVVGVQDITCAVEQVNLCAASVNLYAVDLKRILLVIMFFEPSTRELDGALHIKRHPAVDMHSRRQFRQGIGIVAGPA